MTNFTLLGCLELVKKFVVGSIDPILSVQLGLKPITATNKSKYFGIQLEIEL